MSDPDLREVQDDEVIRAEDTNQLVRAVRVLRQRLAGDPTKPLEGEVHFTSGAPNLGTLRHANSANQIYTFPDESGVVALESALVTDHGELTGLENDHHQQYHTQDRANAWLSTRTTDQLAEGQGNLYHTNSRVRHALGATHPLTYNSGNGVLSLPQANADRSGYLSSADWSAFNAKAEGPHVHSASAITSGVLPVERGGTGLSSLPVEQMLYAASAGTLAAVTLGSSLSLVAGVLSVVANSVVQKVEVAKGGGITGTRKRLNFVDGANVSVTVADNEGADQVDVTVAVSGTLSVGQGGTGVASLATGDMLVGSGSSSMSPLVGNTSTTRKFLTQTGDGSESAMPMWQPLSESDLPAHGHSTSDLTGVLPVEKGGTGLASLGTGELLVGSGSNSVSPLAGNTSTTRKFLSQTGDGSESAMPMWQPLNESDISGVIPVAKGGTGLSTLAEGKLLYASLEGVLAALTLGSTLAIAGGVLNAVSNSSTQKLEVGKGGALVGTRKRLNLVEGSNVSLTVSDNAAEDRVDVTVAASLPPLDLSVCQGRLSAVDDEPVPSSDPPPANNIYFTPFRGNRIALYDGSAWTYRSFDQAALTLSGLTSGKNYDVFVYWDSGTDSLKLELGSAWTNDTTRATDLGDQDFVPTKNGDATRRWVGIIRATNSDETRDTASQRLVFNAYNRVPRVLSSSTASDYTRSLTTFAQVGSVGVQYLSAGEEALELLGTSVLAGVSNTLAILSIGDNSAAKIAAATVAFHAYNNAADSVQGCAQLREVARLGFTERWLIFRSSTASNTVTAYGTSPSGSASPATCLGGLLLC